MFILNGGKWSFEGSLLSSVTVCLNFGMSDMNSAWFRMSTGSLVVMFGAYSENDRIHIFDK